MNILHAITNAATSKRGKFVTIALWLVLAVALVGIAPKLASIYNNNARQDLPSSASSQQATQLLLKEFPGSRGTPAVLVFYDSKGLNATDLSHAKQVSDWLISDKKPSRIGKVISSFTVPQSAKQLTSPDNTTLNMVVTLNGSNTDATFQKTVADMRSYIKNVTENASVQAYVTGPAGIAADSISIFSTIDIKLLLGTVGLVLILLLVLYRSPILALLPLVAVGWTLQIVNALLGFAGRAGLFGVSQQATSIMTVLLFGAGTDYTIFIASRFREELSRTQDKHEAMRKTMRAVGEAITSSAATVILALLTLLLTAIGLYSALGTTLAVAIGVMLLAGLTLIPALLVWIGRAAYWPFVPRYQTEKVATLAASSLKNFWGRLGTWTSKHRVVATIGSTVLLALLALGNIGSQPSFNFLTALRNPTDSTRGYALLQSHFPAGTLAPTTVLVIFKGTNSNAYQHLVQLDAITVALKKVAGVAMVQGPTRPDGNDPGIDPATLQSSIAALPASVQDAILSGKTPAQTGGSQSGAGGQRGPGGQPTNPQTTRTIGAYAASTRFVSPDGHAVQLSVILKDDPYSLTAIHRIDGLSNAVNKALVDNKLSADAYVGGQTSLLNDTLHYNQHDTYLIVPLVLVLVGIILALLLRSLIAPLYLLAAVTLNYFAAIGVCGFFFQRIQGQEGFNYNIPLYTFIFLVALGADYTIFLMSRVREEARMHGIGAGVPLAVSHTGGVITSAGLILAGTFAVLTTLPLTMLYQFGVCVAVGILLDTFIVRALLIPGLVLLLGKWNWWPGKVEQEKKADEQLGAVIETDEPLNVVSTVL